MKGGPKKKQKASPLRDARDKKGSMTNVQLLPATDGLGSDHHRFLTLKDDSSLQKTAEEVEDVDDNEDDDLAEGQVLNPDLIGASYALKDGDLAMYDQIMSGRKSVDFEDLMKVGDDAGTESLKKF